MVGPYPPQPDGIGIHTRNLAEALAPAAHVEVLTRCGPGIGADGHRVMRVLSANPLCLFAATRALRRSAPDVLHYQFNIPALGLAWIWAILAGFLVRRSSGARLFITLHEVRRDTVLLGPVGPYMYRGLARVADVLVVYTSEARTLLVERCRIPGDEVAVMPHGAPDSIREPSKAERERLLASLGLSGPPILLFGYLHPHKGVEHLIAAIADLRRRDDAPLGDRQVLVAGTVRARRGLFRYFESKDRAYERMLHDAVEKGGLSDVVRFAGHVEQEDRDVLLKSAWCAVVPYVDATQSGVLNLLVAAGVPVVASRLPGLEETLGDAGLFVAPGSAPELADAIRRLARDPELHAALSARMRAVHESITFARVAELLIARYHEALGVAPRHVRPLRRGRPPRRRRPARQLRGRGGPRGCTPGAGSCSSTAG